MKRLMTQSFLFGFVVVLGAGCEPIGQRLPREDCDAHDDSPRGSPEEYPLAAGGEVGTATVSPPLMCEKQQAYIHVARAAGRREVGLVARPGVPATGCQELPVTAMLDPTVCPVIAPAAVLFHAFDQLQAQGVFVNGIGQGPCAEAHPTPPRSSMGVVRWEDAEQAVQVVAKVLEDYNLKGGVGVAVRGIDCAYPD